jgi:hypothetical protein
MRIICDFDGTITPQDTTDRVLEALADPAWRELEAQWVAAEISASDCMRGQISLIGGGQEDLDAVLDGAALDPGFRDFVAWAERHGLPVSVVSDGVDYFHHPHPDAARSWPPTGRGQRLVGRARSVAPGTALDAHGLRGGIRGLQMRGDGPWRGDGPTTVYVGDGRSDFLRAQDASTCSSPRVRWLTTPPPAARAFLPF